MTESQEFTLDQLTGRVRTHLRELQDPPCALHMQVVPPFLAMRAAAAADGIELVAFSSFRDFDRQLAIWNGKFRGERPLHPDVSIKGGHIVEAERRGIYYQILGGNVCSGYFIRRYIVRRYIVTVDIAGVQVAHVYATGDESL